MLARKPTTVVIYIGINDVWHSLQGGGTPKEAFEKGLRSIVDRIRAGGARTILCTPTVIGERAIGTNPLDAMLESYSDITRTVATDMKTGLLDLRKACGQHLAAHHAVTKGTFTDDKGCSPATAFTSMSPATDSWPTACSKPSGRQARPLTARYYGMWS